MSALKEREDGQGGRSAVGPGAKGITWAEMGKQATGIGRKCMKKAL